mgnify:CR=1 FL=1
MCETSKTRQIHEVDRSWEEITQADVDAAVQAAAAPAVNSAGPTPGNVDAEQKINSGNAAPLAPLGTDANQDDGMRQDARNDGRGGKGAGALETDGEPSSLSSDSASRTTLSTEQSFSVSNTTSAQTPKSAFTFADSSSNISPESLPNAVQMNNDSDEEKRRYDAIGLLREYIDTNLSDKNVIVLGDLNDDISESSSNNVFQLVLDDPNYQFADIDIANGSSSNWSFPSWPSHLDHILITNELFDEFNTSEVQTIKLDQYISGGWGQYDQNISDHRPVFMKIYPNLMPGDVNIDGVINILDVVMIVQIIIGNHEEVESADFNDDGLVNIIDIVQLIQIIITNE